MLDLDQDSPVTSQPWRYSRWINAAAFAASTRAALLGLVQVRVQRGVVVHFELAVSPVSLAAGEDVFEQFDATPQHIEAVQRKLAVCLAQHDDLSTSLAELLEDIFAGRKRHRTYRQFKMYNDPTLNPYLYQAQQRRAS